MKVQQDVDIRLIIFTSSETLSISIKSELCIQELNSIVCKLLGYSQKIYVYQQPLRPFSKLAFLHPNAKLNWVLKDFSSLCITYQNTQFIQEIDYFASGSHEENAILVIQTCEQNRFSSKMYRMNVSTNINCVKSIASLYGKYFYVQYDQLRINLNKFGSNQLILNTLLKISIRNKIIITADNFQDYAQIKVVFDTKIIDKQRYYIISIEDFDESFILSKQVDWSIVSFMLPIIFGGEIQIYSFKLQSYIKISQYRPETIESTIRMKIIKQKIFKLQKSISQAYFLGIRQNRLFILQKSHILHIFSLKYPYQLINSIILQSEPTNSKYFDGQLSFLKQRYLVLYEILRQSINLKYFNLENGKLMFRKHFKWDFLQFSAPSCNTFDMLSIKLKSKPIIRVFYVNNPNDYIDIEYLGGQWRLQSSKQFCNNFSDQSGYFAIIHEHQYFITIANLHCKSILGNINYLSKIEMNGISFEYKNYKKGQFRLLIYYGRSFEQYRYSENKFVLQKQIMLEERFRKVNYGPSNNIYFINQKIIKIESKKMVFEKRYHNKTIFIYNDVDCQNKQQVFALEGELQLIDIEQVFQYDSKLANFNRKNKLVQMNQKY